MIYTIIGFVVCGMGGGLIGLNYSNGKTALIVAGIVLFIIGMGLVILGSFIGKKNVEKNRLTIKLVVSPSEENIKKLENFLVEEGYKKIKYGEEDVYKLGNGFLTSRKFLKPQYGTEDIEIEAWISPGMGNRPNTEYPLDNSFSGKIPKNQMFKTIEKLKALFTQEAI